MTHTAQKDFDHNGVSYKANQPADLSKAKPEDVERLTKEGKISPADRNTERNA